ncbi:MAG: phosphoribosylformylglycinamidine synthase subunit PurQ, partial [Clostridia bacterium]|nr:phosphoribosylformylglycinamidine synthase subunit PurQ [Clostridia bacterium]
RRVGKVYLLSNAQSCFTINELKECGLYDLFDGIIISSDVGRKKPYGEIFDISETSPTLTFNSIGRHVSCMTYTRVASVKSPWFMNANVGDIHTVAVSHGEGRFVATKEDMEKLIANGQIATQYVDLGGNPSADIAFNPNGSICAVEGITSPDGRVLGKMGHSERKGSNLYKNVGGEKEQGIFFSGVKYFK